MGDKLMPMPF